MYGQLISLRNGRLLLLPEQVKDTLRLTLVLLVNLTIVLVPFRF